MNTNNDQQRFRSRVGHDPDAICVYLRLSAVPLRLVLASDQRRSSAVPAQ
jgi:hypothetical protein